jgi:hypothetical protein
MMLSLMVFGPSEKAAAVIIAFSDDLEV